MYNIVNNIKSFKHAFSFANDNGTIRFEQSEERSPANREFD